MNQNKQILAKIKNDPFEPNNKGILIFQLKDSTHEFSLDLAIILRCLAILETTPFIPDIPKTWWEEIKSTYQSDFQSNLLLDSVQSLHCDECRNPVVFLMEDQVCNFYMGLDIVIQCLAHAERIDYLPQLPSIFWQAIVGKYDFGVVPKHFC